MTENRGEFHVEEYRRHMFQYEKESNEYNNKNWFGKLISNKPIKPKKKDYIW